MKSLVILKLEEASLLQGLDRNRDEQREIYQKAWCEKYGISIGDIITYGKEKKTGVMVKFDFDSSHDVHHPCVALLNWDGKQSKRHTRIYSYEFPTIKKVIPEAESLSR